MTPALSGLLARLKAKKYDALTVADQIHYEHAAVEATPTLLAVIRVQAEALEFYANAVKEGGVPMTFDYRSGTKAREAQAQVERLVKGDAG